ncbi:ABC transporter substrate-binding protein [Lactococcus sp.]|uniref:ABC transporter substrate-binding protein n=1 Tax=Lactococcus sp. TaxID=44273 RepID=UPI002FC8D73C
MNLRKIVIGSAIVLAGVGGLTACGKSGNNASKDGKTTITFWAATNPTQYKFWQNMAKDYEKANPDITIKVSQMKESPTSEATIQAAIASNTQPTMSENISRSFAAQLADSKAIIPLQKEKGFEDLVNKRNMSKTMKNWEFSGGNEYVFPIYVNPMMFAWNTVELKKLGFDKSPTTYSEVEAVAKKMKEENSKKVIWQSPNLTNTTGYQRWFDFFLLYNAASNGSQFVSNNEYKANSKSLSQVYGFMSDLSKVGALNTDKTESPFEKGLSLASATGSWNFPYWHESFPKLQYGKTYDITMPPAPDGTDKSNIKTFADSKGIVVYSKATKKEKEAAVDFMEYVFKDSKNDLAWMKTTSLTPATENATSNKEFKEYFDKNPVMKKYADAVPDAIPAMDNSKYSEIQQAFSEKAWVPVVNGKMNAADAVKETEKSVNNILGK